MDVYTSEKMRNAMQLLGSGVDTEEMAHEGEKAGRFGDGSAVVIAACIEVHRHLGPGLLESAYERCLCHELSLRGLSFERQRPLPLIYKGVHLECGYRLDIVVGGSLLVEVKAVERLLPVHEAQVLTYLRLTKLPAALIVNFNVAVLRHGLRRLTYNPNYPFPPSRLHVV
ncbi:GxxExxY protein [Sorangium sp. So ce861]|uniref:GxxExxY protein n=1 Tax=Sorangium sp. So ce861 TaxID=3133323 RepID=UPI003F5FAC88